MVLKGYSRKSLRMLLLDVVVYNAYSMAVVIRLERLKFFEFAAVDGMNENGHLNKERKMKDLMSNRELYDIFNLQCLINGFVQAFEIEDANRFFGEMNTLCCHL
ncbi:hypothetical protein H5410_053445 [Solanum commersonii]|uniref:Pentatricopeptide repeat-containing protein n=1 Tax=Solanum commersonii TaxID=4109 RepID=A0A9J5X4G9_SOLCO|nr:hypothetical protein H5410_053445 [Solanum commersonii]